MKIRLPQLSHFGSATAAGLCLLLVNPLTAHAEKLSRGQAVRRALQQNPQVAAAQARVAQTEAQLDQIGAARYPALNVTVGVGPSLKAKLVPGSAIESTRNAYGDVRLADLSVVFQGTITAIQPLYTFGKIDDREAATLHKQKARQHETEMKQADIALETARLYETLLFARQSASFFEEMLHGLESTIEKTKAEVAADRLSQSDVLRLNAARGLLLLGQSQALAGQAQATSGIVAYVGLPTGSTVEPVENQLSELNVPLPTLAQLQEQARRGRPELFALREGQAGYNKLADAESAGNLPNFFAAAFASGAYTPGRDLVETRFTYDPLNYFVPGALVGASWQLQGGMADGRASEARARALELRQLEQWALAGIPAEVSVALDEVERARRDIAAADAAADDAKQWAVHANADFAVGLGSSQELTDATAAYVQLRLALFRARFEHNVALATLSKALGTFTSGVNSPYPTKD